MRYKHQLVTMLISAMLIPAAATLAQDYPSRQIRLIIPFAAGGGNDIIGRQVAQKMSELLGQQIVVDNRGGAGGSIGMEIAAGAAPDGYTIVLGHIGTLAVNPTLMTKLRYDPLRDFLPVSLVAKLPALMAIHPSIPATTVSQFIALSKARPGRLTYGSGGTGGANHLSTEYFKLVTKTDLTHVPYKSAGLATTDVLAGNIAMIMPAVPVVLPHIRSGKLRALGVSSESRLPIAPEIPTIAESGVPEFKVSQWYGILAPASTSISAISVLQSAVSKAVNAPDLRKKMIADGTEPSASTSDDFRNLIATEIRRWAPIIKAIEPNQ